MFFLGEEEGGLLQESLEGGVDESVYDHLFINMEIINELKHRSSLVAFLEFEQVLFGDGLDIFDVEQQADSKF